MSLSRRMLLAAGAAAVPLGLMSSGLVSPAFAKAPPLGIPAPAAYRYKVGDVEVTEIGDGVAFRSVEGFVKNADVADVRKVLAEAFQPTDSFPVGFTTLVLNIGGKLVLIDTGNGDYALATSGTWMTNFRAAGFDPANVDLVVQSHFHPDHINGTRDKSGLVRFPNAEVIVPAPEWAFWMDDGMMSQAPAGMKPAFEGVRRVFSPMAKEVRHYQWGQEVAPGLHAVSAPGHTPGHTAFMLTSAGKSLMIMSDVTNHTTLFVRRPEWTVMFDMDGPQAIVTRKKMLDMAASERTQVAFYHAPFPATGHIERDGKGYAFVPLEWAPV